jgi:hypothetical protein
MYDFNDYEPLVLFNVLSYVEELSDPKRKTKKLHKSNWYCDRCIAFRVTRLIWKYRRVFLQGLIKPIFWKILYAPHYLACFHCTVY